MKKRYIIPLLFLLIFFSIVDNDRALLDGYKWEVLPIFNLFNEDTEYSSDYSHKKFRKLEIGMSKEEVVKIIGQPLKKWDYSVSEEYFYYSKSPGDTHFRPRVVQFKNGKVINIHNEFYID